MRDEAEQFETGSQMRQRQIRMASQSDGSAHPRTHIRFVTLSWCLWLLGAWGVTLAMDAIVPAARWMVYSSALGLFLVWPAYHLSITSPDLLIKRYPRIMIVQTALEWFTLVVILQAVIWPLKVTAEWSMSQTLLINAAIVTWSSLTGLVVAWSILGNEAWRRLVGMCMVVLLVFASPVMGMILPSVMDALSIQTFRGEVIPTSSMQTLWRLTDQINPFEASAFVTVLIPIGLAGLLGWIGLLVIARPDLNNQSGKSL